MTKNENPFKEMHFVDPSKFYFWLGSDQEVYYHADGTDTPISGTTEGEE
jgi:hypothetical protein